MSKEYKDTRLKAGGEGDDRGWDGWMASPTQWTWVWIGFRRWWWTGKPGVLQSMGSQRVRHDWVTGLNWTELNWTELRYYIEYPKAIFIYNNINHGGADSKASCILITCLIINPINLRLCDWTIIPYQIRNANSTHK